MPAPSTQACPHREAVEALAREALPDERRRAVQRHLERCEPCRSAFRTLTADWFPRLRSYTVVERIGAGGFGEVFKVIHHAKQRTEALKLLHAETRFRTASFENEAHLIAQLHHPGIVTLYDAQLGTPPLYYTMELVEGQQLDDYFRSPDVTLAERIEIFRQIALAMDYAHRQGVVHRDLKPQNILIDTAGQPHIVDFGIARMLAPAGDAGDTADRLPPQPEGSYGYVAPEEDAGEDVDARADIYALGVLLYQGVTGEPFSSNECLEKLAALLRRRGVSRAGDLAAIIARCLQEDPARRYPTCAEVARDLGRLLAARSVRARTRPSLGYAAARTLTGTLLSHPRFVCWILILIVAASLSALYCQGLRRWLAPGSENRGVILIAFGPSTLDAIRDGRVGAGLDGLALDNRKSWRLLYGEVLGTLAQASPRAVVWDGFFPDCHAEYDAGLLRGFEALRAGGVPVVIGVKNFDVNGQPLGCEHILDAVHACAALHGVAPSAASHEFFVPICIRRGLAAPIPTLPVAGFAAARFPDCELDLRVEGERVLACYRRRHHAGGEPAWRSEVDELPIAMRERDRVAHILGRDDEVLCTKVRQATPGEWAGRVVPFEDVLTASRRQLDTWFAGRVVVYGQMLPGQDVHGTLHGAEIHGCQVHAQALDELLDRAYLRRFSRRGVVLRTLLWCCLAGVIAPLVPSGAYGATRLTKLACVILCAAGVAVVAVCLATSSRWSIEAALGGSSILIAGSLAYLCRAGRAKLARIGPGPGWPRDAQPRD